MSPTQRALRFDKADLAFEVFPVERTISGLAKLDFTIQSPLTQVSLDLDRNFIVTALNVNGVALKPSDWSNPKGRLQFMLPGAMQIGAQLTIAIAYRGTPHVAVRAPWDGGIVWAKTPGGAPFIATAHQMQGCDLLWPCIDHPQAEPAVAELHITVPKGLSAPANGVLQGITEHPDGRRTFNWRALRPNTYAIALNVAPYEVLRSSYKSRYGNIIPMEFWHLPGKPEQASSLFAEFPQALDFFETVIGPYPFGDEKVGVAETPHKGMEHQTMNAYGNSYAKTAFGFDDLFHHEFAHEWFANQLTNSDADDFWLQEGFGSYMQPLYAKWRGGDFAYIARLHAARSGIRNCFPIISGTSRTVDQVYLPATGPAGDIYSKGSWVLHTLRGLIGDKAFFRATRRLVYGRADPAPGNFKPRFGSSAEFMALVNEETGQDYDWFFDVYLRQALLPELLSETRGGELHLQWKVPGGGSFPLPVEVQVGEKVTRVRMMGGSGSIALPPGAHVVLDPNGNVLKRSRDIEALQRWQYEQAKASPKMGEAPPMAPCPGK